MIRRSDPAYQRAHRAWRAAARALRKARQGLSPGAELEKLQADLAAKREVWLHADRGTRS